MKKVFYSVFMLLLAGSLLGQKPMAAHKITSYLEAFELDANDFLLQNLNEQVKPAPQQSQRSINSCVSIPGIPCDEGALDLLDFDFVPPGSINDCSVVADAGTDDNCFNPGDIPSGVTFSTTNDQGFEQGLVTLGEGSLGAPSGVFGPTAFSDDLVISFSVPTSYVEFDYLSLLGSGTVAVEVYDGDASLICSNYSARLRAG